MRVEQKKQKTFFTRLHAKPWISCNLVPQIINATDADHRRNVIIEFPYTFDEGIADVKQFDKLNNEYELSGIFNALMAPLRRVLKSERITLSERTIAQRRMKYELICDPVKVFVETAFVEDSIAGRDFTLKDSAYEAYQLFCVRKKIVPISKATLGKKLVSRDFSFKEGMREMPGRNDMKRYHCWLDLRPTNDYLTSLGYAPITTQQSLTPE